MIERFRMYSARFKQASVSGEVYTETLQYIIRLRKERDEARRELCIALGKDHFAFTALPGEHNHFNAARDRGWDCFGEEP